MTAIPLPRATPSAAGVASTGIAAFLDAVAAEGLELHSFMLYRAGAVVAEGFWKPYRADRLHMQHSATKSWTAAAVGLALDAGLFTLDDKVVGFFPGHLPPVVSDNLRAMTVRDLLTMRTGHATGISGGEWRNLETSWIAAFLQEPVPEAPGTRFIYSSASSYMLSAIVTHTTGQTVRAYLEDRMIRPLGMGEITWDTSPEGISSGGNGLSCTTEDVLKFGILHLQRGRWQGRQVLPESWVAEATRKQVDDVRLGRLDGKRYLAPSDSDPVPAERRDGYGYQWWMTPHGGYRASGVFGQQCIVLPAQDSVIAITAGLNSTTPRLLAATWTHLFPALGHASPADDATLGPRLAALALPRPAGTAAAPAIAGGRFAFPPNEDGISEISLDFSPDRCVFSLQDGRGRHIIAAGIGQPIEADTTMTGHMLHHQYQPPSLRVVAEGAWTAPDRFEMMWRFVETAFCDHVTLHLTETGLRYDRAVNANAGPTERPTLRGTRA